METSKKAIAATVKISIMAGLYIMAMLLMCAPSVFASTVVYRIDPTPVMTTTGNVPIGGYPTAYLVPNATIKLCTNSTCTALATAYTDGTGNAACSVLTPVTLPGTSVCVATAGSQGQFGFWIQPGNYYYTVTTSLGTFGPYPISSPTIGVLGGPGIVSANGVGGLAPMTSNLDCSVFTGASASLKITACANGLPSSGGTLDTRNIQGSQTWNTDAFSGITKPIDFICQGTTFVVSLNSTVPLNVNLVAGKGCLFSVNSGVTLTINGPITPIAAQIFSGTGSISLASNHQIVAVDPRWFGADPAGVNVSTSGLQSAINAAGGGHLVCPPNSTFLIDGPLYLYPANQGITWDGPANCVIRAKSGVTAFNMIVDGSGSASGGSTVGSIGGFTIDGIDKSTGSCLNGFMVYDHDWGLYNQLFVQNCANDGIIVSQWGSANTTSTGAATMGVTTALTLANISPNGYTIHAFDLLLLDCDGTSATTTGCNAGNAGAEQVEVMSVLGSVVTLTAPVALDHMAGFRVNRSGFGDLLTFNNPYVIFAGNAGFEIMPGSDVNGIMVNDPIALHGDVTNMILRGNNGTVNGGQFTASGNEAIRLGETTDGDSFSAKYWTIHNPGDLEANSQDCILVSTHSLGIYVDGILNSQVCNNASTGSSGNGVVVTSGVGNWTVTNSNSSTASVGSFNIIPFVGSGGNSGVSVFAGCGSSACNNALTFSSYKAAPIDLNVASSPGAGGAAGTGGVRGGNGSTVTWSFTSGGALTTSAGASIGGSTMINGTLTDQVTSIDESSNAGADAHLNFRTATYNSATMYQSESTGNLVIDPSSRTLEVRSTASSFQVNGGGIVVGAATGGAKGSGTINVASDIYKNNTAYTNPDYAFEKFYSGKIVKFAKNPGASQYAGLLPLPALRKYAQLNFALPGVHEASGMFERNDVLLEKLEEAYLYIFQLSDRVTKLENAKRK